MVYIQTTKNPRLTKWPSCKRLINSDRSVLSSINDKTGLKTWNIVISKPGVQPLVPAVAGPQLDDISISGPELFCISLIYVRNVYQTIYVSSPAPVNWTDRNLINVVQWWLTDGTDLLLSLSPWLDWTSGFDIALSQVFKSALSLMQGSVLNWCAVCGTIFPRAHSYTNLHLPMSLKWWNLVVGPVSSRRIERHSSDYRIIDDR